jgi:pimeloyl-ACP methyl ester carboxylesterase
MSTDVRSIPHGIRRPHRAVIWSALAVAGAVAGFGVHRAFFSAPAPYPWPPVPCVVQGINARCGTFVVPENRANANGRTLGLYVVILPAFLKPARTDAVAYLDGGPGSPATAGAADRARQLTQLAANRDILLVDQRGTGRSTRHDADATQYGTRMAMDDLDAVRAALGYRQLDVIGSSYGATAAQVYVKLHPRSVRMVALAGGTAIDVPFFARYAVNAQRALDQIAHFCAAEPGCRKAFPNWERQFGELVKAWNARRVHGRTGDELAATVHVMLLDGEKAVSVPLIVAGAAKGDYGPLDEAGSGDLDPRLGLMSSIWCSEPWTGLQANGPWGTEFDSYAAAQIAAFRHRCGSAPKRAEPHSLWTLPTGSRVPVIAFVGGADPQDPLANLSNLKKHFPDSRIVVFPRVGHSFGIGGCVDAMMADVADRGTTKGVDTTRCIDAVVTPPFPLAD